MIDDNRPIGRYAWRGGEELVFAVPAVTALSPPPAFPTHVLVVAPWFEEANRTRRLLAGTMRRLAAQGVACLLPDLPGTGESLVALQDVRLADWREALAACAAALDAPFLTLSVRGGALIDDVQGAIGHLRFAPAEGQAIVRDMMRARLAAAHDDGAALATMAGIEAQAAAGPIELAGHRIGAPLLADMRSALVPSVSPLRTIRLATDPAPADVRFEAPPPWRRAEPGDDPLLADRLASDMLGWIRTCAG